ncbi:MAG: NAD(+)/NADH kinase [Candidatus Lambdaproteobacteria bacterium]|nr:NAD(+)/NADH kinase [Candidatus Lambdaproteobacteria bacterium]
MIRLRTVGLLLRESQDAYPLAQLKAVLDRVGARLHILNQGPAPEKLDLVIALGGDGTVLKALDLSPDCPVLAVNFGTVGFLTAGDRGELERLLRRLLADDYVVSERLLLRCEAPFGISHAVNEVVLRSSNRMISVDVFVDDTKIRRIRADGVIVGTPTGSTGYLLSTGAPIVMPDVDCLILDGINEYNFTSRALILSPSAHIRLHLPTLLPGQQVTVVVDGNDAGMLQADQELRLTRSERRASLVFFDKHYFFHNLSSRLSWN